MTLMAKKPRVFLCHSGLDARRATELATTLEQRLAELANQIEVFNTSKPVYRYKDLREILTAGEKWRPGAERYEEELRTYLTENMENSSAFVSLVTPESLTAGSKVIEFEIETACSMATRKNTPFFFPCVAAGASFADLPPNATQFQGIDLDAEEGLTRLVDAVRRALLQAVDA